ncbi:transketolase family protein [Aliarcobacter butzleri]|uniref:transketolase family protein n=1 Tax=Aliarcobacter butzleri TaxID=28197 RepID=UPI0021B1693D|nr:transketolase C-terminal domain-containing protein [Aliarcobacter butzleri]MCG3714301.1 1-deoxy-D-xylulose-5-phosphate synthase [Aliarcobacter butzleri]MCT7552838.1 1-deoxy-D-xylulose-5-phosphate synthase [Aliarcobacter butzleri]MDK2090969.1 transketolase C-terminal domain-containing protein [Aliarcobacter butzleri]
MRNTFVKTLVKLAEKDERIIVITPDLGFSVLEEFEEKFPDRFLNVGIAEANAVSIASGLALSGKIVYLYSIIPFVTMRPFEQIRVDVAYMNTNVRLVGVGAGVTYGPAGATHHSVEDIAIMRALPNMTVFSPCDPYEVEKITEESLRHVGPIYFRLAKKGEPIISDMRADVKLGKANYIQKKENSKLSIIFTGNASDIAMDVASELTKKGLQVDVISMHSIKPFDYKTLEQIISNKNYVFTIEEHSIIGGLGSIVSEYIAESKYNPIFKRFGLPDEYSHYVGSQFYIRNKFNFTVKKIIDSIGDLL